jgi:hypothetical protein
MAVTIRALTPEHVAPLRAMLSRDAGHNLYLLGLLEEFGIVCSVGHAPFEIVGRFSDDELTAALFVGSSGGLLIPSATQAPFISEITQHVASSLTFHSCLGEKPMVDAVLQHVGSSAPYSRLQRLYLVSADDLGPHTNPLLRLATDADIEQLIPMSAACVKELYERDPLQEDAEGFSLRIKRRVTTSRTYVLEEGGRLVFKLDIGARSQFGAELEGFYTIPGERRKGHATLCLGQISRFLLSSLPRLALRIDELNPSFAKAARRVGYHLGRPQRVVVM